MFANNFLKEPSQNHVPIFLKTIAIVYKYYVQIHIVYMGDDMDD